MQWQTSFTGSPGASRVKPQAVVAPPDHQGVGNALRSAFLPRISDMPGDIADLLEKLD